MLNFNRATCSANQDKMKGVITVKINGQDRKIAVAGDTKDYSVNAQGKDSTLAKFERGGVTFQEPEIVQLYYKGKPATTMYFDSKSQNYVSNVNESSPTQAGKKDFEYNDKKGCRVTNDKELNTKLIKKPVATST